MACLLLCHGGLASVMALATLWAPSDGVSTKKVRSWGRSEKWRQGAKKS